jgi:hypothetical protein
MISFGHSNVFIWSLLFISIFIKDQIDRPPFFLESLELALSLIFSPRVHGTSSLRYEWLVGALWSDLCALTCEQAPCLTLRP